MGQCPVDNDTGSKGCRGKPESPVKAVTRSRNDDTTEAVVIVNSANYDKAVAVVYFVDDAAIFHNHRWVSE
jgi:hypothetical protein